MIDDRAPDRAWHLVDATMFWHAQSGGVRRYLRAKHAWASLREGWHHTIATPIDDADSEVQLPSLPLPFSHGYRLPLNRSAAARRLAAEAPDLLEADDPYRLAWAVLDASQQLGVPAVAYCHSNLEALGRSVGGAAAARLARRYARRLYGHFDLVLAPSEAMAGHLQDWGVPRVRAQALGVDTAVFHPHCAEPGWRVRAGVPPQAKVMLYAGRFAPEKRLDVLAEAVRRLGAGYWLVAIGAGPRPPSGERVLVLPHCGDDAHLAQALASADAFVHAGLQETFGLAVLEALACGTPVVASAAEGLAELVDESVGAALDRPHAAAFAEAAFAVTQRDRVALGRAARDRALGYDWQRVLQRLFGHYRELLQRPGGRAEALVEAVAS